MAKQRILMIDDDEEILNLLKVMLERPEWELHTATDAIDGLTRARDLRPAVIISDVQMPQFGTGTEMVHAIRMDRALKDTPVIMLTSMDLERVKFQLPKDDPKVRLLNKPPQAELLMGVIRDVTGTGTVDSAGVNWPKLEP